MREQEIRLLRCIGDIDNKLILEADTARFRSRTWAHLAALAACRALVVSIPFLLPKTSEKAPLLETAPQLEEEQKHSTMLDQESAAGPEYAVDGSAVTLGGLTPGMTEDQIRSLLGEPAKITEDNSDHRYRWLYNDLTVVFHDLNHTVREIRAFPDSGLSLSSGIGFTSTEAEVIQCYPDAWSYDGDKGEEKADTFYDVSLGEQTLTIAITNGIVSRMDLVHYGDPLYDALTANPVTIYTMNEKAGWDSVTAIDKAAKTICVTMTISEPEPVEEFPATTPYWMLDFGTGVFAILHDDDIVKLYTYDTPPVFTTNEELYDQLTPYLTGRYTGIDDAVKQALANPLETWN